MNAWLKRFAVVVLVVTGLALGCASAEAGPWAGFRVAGSYATDGYPGAYWGYAPGVTLPPIYAYPPYGVFYVPYYPPMTTWSPVGAYYYTYPAQGPIGGLPGGVYTVTYPPVP